MENVSFKVRFMAITAVTAAIYMVATVAIAPISFNVVQLRLSEVMVLLAFIDKKYGPGLILGCFIANLFSPIWMIDVVFGTLGTVIAVFGIVRSKSLFMATLWPVISMVSVSAGIAIGSSLPYIPTLLTVMAEEFAVVVIIGYPLFKILLKNEKLIDLLKF